MAVKPSNIRPKKPFNLIPLWFALWAVVLYLIIFNMELSFEMVVYGVNDMVEYFSRYTSPDFSELYRYIRLMVQTIAAAFWGTVFAVVVAFILAPFAARNMTPNMKVYRIAREVLNFMRALPDILLALIFVAALGLGPLPGALALGVHTAGFLGKFFAESLEHVDHGVIEALQSTGASHTQVVMYAGWPSIMRESIGYTLYIMDRNVRMASVLGMVGAGGIGLALHDTLRLFRYGKSATLILVILSVILAFDYFSTWLRGKLA